MTALLSNYTLAPGVSWCNTVLLITLLLKSVQSFVPTRINPPHAQIFVSFSDWTPTMDHAPGGGEEHQLSSFRFNLPAEFELGLPATTFI